MDLSSKSYVELLQLRLELNQQLEPVQAALAVHEGKAFETLKAGGSVPGFKLKKGRKTRKLIDTDKLVQRLLAKEVSKADIYDIKIKGVPAIDKLIKDTFEGDEATQVYDRFVTETLGKPSIEYTGV